METMEIYITSKFFERYLDYLDDYQMYDEKVEELDLDTVMEFLSYELDLESFIPFDRYIRELASQERLGL